MHPCLATISCLHHAESFYRALTALVMTNIWAIRKLRFFGVVGTLADFCKSKLISASWTSINNRPCPNLPKYPSPRDLISLQKLNEGLCVPSLVRLMLSYFSPININKQDTLLRVGTSDPKLVFCIQMATVNAAVDFVLFLVNEILKLVHKEFWLKTISLIFKIVQNL